MTPSSIVRKMAMVQKWENSCSGVRLTLHGIILLPLINILEITFALIAQHREKVHKQHEHAHCNYIPLAHIWPRIESTRVYRYQHVGIHKALVSF